MKPVDLFLQCDEGEGISKLKHLYEVCQMVAKSLPPSGAQKNMLITMTSCTVTMFSSNDKNVSSGSGFFERGNVSLTGREAALRCYQFQPAMLENEN